MGKNELDDAVPFVGTLQLAGMSLEAQIHSIHPSDNGGFTWVTCRLTIQKDVMRDSWPLNPFAGSRAAAPRNGKVLCVPRSPTPIHYLRVAT